MKADDNSPLPASVLIDAKIESLDGWRGTALARMRALILATDANVLETWKWRGTPVWERGGIICTGESYKDKIKLTFAKGASLNDPDKLFNASLEGNARRAIDIYEGDEVDAASFQALVREAILQNTAAKKKRG